MCLLSVIHRLPCLPRVAQSRPSVDTVDTGNAETARTATVTRMDNFRRPLGVLLASILVFVVSVVATAVTVNAEAVWPQMVFGWLAVVALATGLGALAVISWRLVRRPKSAAE